MLSFRMYRAPISTDHVVSFDELYAAMPDEFAPVIRPTRETQANALRASSLVDVPPKDQEDDPFAPGGRDRPIHGDVFVDEDRTMYIVEARSIRRAPRIARPNGGQVSTQEHGSTTELWLTCVGATPNEDRLAEVASILSTVFNVELAPYYFPSQRVDELKGEGLVAVEPPDAATMSAARLLADRLVRTALMSVKASGGLLISDLAKQLPEDARGRRDDVRRQLETAGLVQSEAVVLCKRTAAQTARAQSRADLLAMAAQGLRCACGKSVQDESIEDAISITDLGRELLNHSRWFSLLLVDELALAGVPPEAILVDQTVAGDEMDCIANISGEAVLFELKDKEFSLGNAYSFGAKIGIIRPNHAVIVSSERVGNDVKEHFQRAGYGGRRPQRYALLDEGPATPEEVRYVEGTERLREGIATLASGIYARDAVTTLRQVLSLAAVRAEAVVATLAATDGIAALPRAHRTRKQGRG